MNSKGSYRIASIFLAITSVLYGVALVLEQFQNVVNLAVPAVLYLLLALFLFNGKRWAAWLTFLCMLIGITSAIISAYSTGNSPVWLFQAIAVLNMLVALALFVVLWRTHVVKPPKVRASLQR